MAFSPESNSSWRPENDTYPRYSLADEALHIRDAFITHPAGKLRLIEYPFPTDEITRNYYYRLHAANLILGEVLPSYEPSMQYVRIPNSARPLIYDSVSDSEGAYSYGDDQLFYDLGRLLGKASKLDLIVTSDIGRATAYVEFTKPNEDESRVLFQPGVEYRVVDGAGGHDIAEEYAAKLTSEFNDQFTTVQQFYNMGLADGIDS